MPEDAKDKQPLTIEQMLQVYQERKDALEHLARTLKATNAARVYCPQLFIKTKYKLPPPPDKITNINDLMGDEFPFSGTTLPDFVGAFGKGINFIYDSGAGNNLIALYIQKITPVFVKDEWDNEFDIEGKSITPMGNGTFKGKISPKLIKFVKVASKESIKHGDWPRVYYTGDGAGCKGYIGTYYFEKADKETLLLHPCDKSNHNFILTSSRFHHERKYCYDCKSESRCEGMWKKGREEFAKAGQQTKATLAQALS